MPFIRQDIKQITRIDKELDKLIKQDPDIYRKFNHLKSIPGFDMLLSAHLLVMTEIFSKISDYKRLAALIGIVPYKYQSGLLSTEQFLSAEENQRMAG